MKRWMAVLGSLAVASAALLSLRASFFDPIGQLEQQVGGPVLTTSVQVPQGSITFYRYVKGEVCGAGIVYRIGGKTGQNRNGGGPCSNRTNTSPLTNNAMSQSRGRTPFVLLHGLVDQDQIARVMVKIGGAEPRKAEVVYGFWYMLIPGASEIPAYTVEGESIVATEATP